MWGKPTNQLTNKLTRLSKTWWICFKRVYFKVLSSPKETRHLLSRISWLLEKWYTFLKKEINLLQKIYKMRPIWPFYPFLGSHRGSWSSKKWFGMTHQVVRYISKPLQPYSMQQQMRWHCYNGGESVFLERTLMRGINQYKKLIKHRKLISWIQETKWIQMTNYARTYG